MNTRVAIVGHSWGGVLAMAYAAAHPTRVDRMILIGPGGPTLEFVEWFNDTSTRGCALKTAKHGVDADKAALEHFRAVVPGYFFQRAKGLAFASQLADGTVKPQVTGGIEKGYDSRPGLRQLDRPVLIVQGHQDPVGDKTAEDRPWPAAANAAGVPDQSARSDTRLQPARS